MVTSANTSFHWEKLPTPAERKKIGQMTTNTSLDAVAYVHMRVIKIIYVL